MVLPLASVIAIGILWSVFWWYQIAKAEAEFERGLDKFAARDVEISCEDRSWRGYPFRMEAHCRLLRTHWLQAGNRSRVAVDRVTAVAQIYALDHVLLLIEAPSTFTEHANGGETPRVAVDAVHSPATASVVFEGDRIDRLSFIVRDLEAGLSLFDARGARPGGALKAGLLNIHMRVADASGDAGSLMEVAGEVDDLRILPDYDGPDPGGGFILDRLELRFSALNPEDRFQSPIEIIGRILSPGGTVSVDRIYAVAGSVRILAGGDVTFDAQGRANGTLASSVVNLPDLVDKLEQMGRIDTANAPVARMALSALAGATAGEDGAVRVNLRLREGELYLGPFRIASIPPL